ncbi:bifunctional metallophosphatase/5'-nucleotidase [Phytohalomonas tamaricis]|uniref:bifunctional metallophosphatase/5'-nucleotidase n=1 Tax=Phytohalomonas tamaricis TaxID=2081032 RepID=UPI000D0B76FB|nr:bifunctional metallophosphatase/5'-nucleotidase [Phytohalomonas tamaricis]
MAYRLQLLHASDMEGGGTDLLNAPDFVAVTDYLEDQEANSIFLSSGDLLLSGPYQSAAGTDEMQPALQRANEQLYGLEEGSLSGLEAGTGRVDITLANLLDTEAVTFGNHEFDQGTSFLESLLAPDVSGTDLADIAWTGTQFPYLSSNLDFSTDSALGPLATEQTTLSPDAFQADPEALVSDYADDGDIDVSKIAPSTVIEEGGERIGVIGVTTQVLESISSPGDVTVEGNGEDDMAALAAIIQPQIDAMESDGINKIIISSHLQQIQLEEELATLLDGADIIIAGGSHNLLADQEDLDRDLLQSGESAPYASYPILTEDAAGDDVAIINTPSGWNYVGQLTVEFDDEGRLDPASIDPTTSGVYAANDEQVEALWGDLDSAFAEGTKGAIAQELVDAVQTVVEAQDSNVLGLTDVYLEGRREEVRTEETNLGDLSADANLWYAQQVDDSVQVSFKNGGGIREAIGEVNAVGSETSLEPPADGEVSQLDAGSALRFNNDLSLLTLTRAELVEVLEHAVAASEEDQTPGQFAQVAGISYSFDWDQEAGNRIQSAAIVDEAGEVTDVLVRDGELVGNASDEVRVVTLGFMADGGDGYPLADVVADNAERVDRVDLVDAGIEDGAFIFADTGTEQDAFAEYLGAFYSDDPYSEADTPVEEDERIQNLAYRDDTVLASVDDQNEQPDDSGWTFDVDLSIDIDINGESIDTASLVQTFEQQFEQLFTAWAPDSDPTATLDQAFDQVFDNAFSFLNLDTELLGITPTTTLDTFA